MKWTRKELKERAKAALKRNYWKVVFVSFIFIFLSGGANFSSGSSWVNNGSGEKANELVVIETDALEEEWSQQEEWDHKEEEAPEEETSRKEEGIREEKKAPELTDGDGPKRKAFISDMIARMGDGLEHSFRRLEQKNIAVIVSFAVMLIVIIVVVLFIAIAVDVFLLNPLWIGAQRFLLKCVDDRGNISELGYTFDHHYLNGVKTAFLRDLHVLLWALLFIIPGIYKKYQYYMVEFILAENPALPCGEVLKYSREMMEGHKWNAFVLDLSFILWHMLSFFTCGLSEIFFVRPYVNLTRAALYRELTGQRSNGAAYIEMRPEEDPTGQRSGGFGNGI